MYVVNHQVYPKRIKIAAPSDLSMYLANHQQLCA